MYQHRDQIDRPGNGGKLIAGNAARTQQKNFIAAHLHDKSRCFCLFATHYFELTAFPADHHGAVNMHAVTCLPTVTGAGGAAGTGAVIADLTEPGDFVLCKGGKGGFYNREKGPGGESLKRAVDLWTGDSRDSAKARLDSLEIGSKDLRRLAGHPDRGGRPSGLQPRRHRLRPRDAGGGR